VTLAPKFDHFNLGSFVIRGSVGVFNWGGVAHCV